MSPTPAQSPAQGSNTAVNTEQHNLSIFSALSAGSLSANREQLQTGVGTSNTTTASSGAGLSTYANLSAAMGTPQTGSGRTDTASSGAAPGGPGSPTGTAMSRAATFKALELQADLSAYQALAKQLAPTAKLLGEAIKNPDLLNTNPDFRAALEKALSSGRDGLLLAVRQGNYHADASLINVQSALRLVQGGDKFSKVPETLANGNLKSLEFASDSLMVLGARLEGDIVSRTRALAGAYQSYPPANGISGSGRAWGLGEMPAGSPASRFGEASGDQILNRTAP